MKQVTSAGEWRDYKQMSSDAKDFWAGSRVFRGADCVRAIRVAYAGAASRPVVGMGRPQVEVRLAYAWDCPDCSHENFVRAVIYEFSPAEQEEMAEDLGKKPQTGHWMSKPTEVECANCGLQCRAIDDGEQVDSEE